MKNNKKIINEFLDYISKVRKFSNHTIRSYRTDLEQFLVFLTSYNSKILITDIDKSVIQHYIQKLSKSGIGDKTLLRKVSTIKSLYSIKKILNRSTSLHRKISKLKYHLKHKWPKYS